MTLDWALSQIDCGGEEECWPWRGTYFSDGYGRIRQHHAHRVVWSLVHGYMPASEFPIRHTCDNPQCCNPGHLLIGTAKQNVEDMYQRGRARPGGHNQQGEANGHVKLTAVQVAAIRTAYRSGGVRQVDLARQYGTGQTNISRIVRGENWVTV